MMKNIWCPLPWSHLGVKNNGTLRMCSHSQSAGVGNTVLHQDGKSLTIENLDDTDVLNCETLKQVRRDFMAGNFPSQCKRCQVEKSAGHRSRDEWETLKHHHILTREEALSKTLPDGTYTEPKILSLDLRVGHQCNLRCTMCFPGEATKWYKDYEEIMQEKTFWVDGKEYDLNIRNADFDWARSEEKVDSLIRAGKYIDKIKFGGGEPLLLKHCHSLVRKLVEADYAKNIEIEYSSNLTIFPDELWELWKNFREVKICSSLDAYGIANEAIRYPSKWNVVESNLDMLDDTPDNMTIFTSTTISMLSLEHWADLLLWLDSKNFKKVNSKTHNFSASHPVYNPKYLNIAILDEENFNNIINVQKSKIENSTSNKKESLLQKIEFYEKFYNFMKVKDDVDIYRKQFAERFGRFAKNQNQDWDSIFPMASNIAKQWKEQYGL
jgi:sulfatase maturation enzyme AslB (radical SAM superfamily)